MPRPPRLRRTHQGAPHQASPLPHRLDCAALATCLALTACLILAGCSTQQLTRTRADPPSAPPSQSDTAAMVPSTAPTDASQYTCPGIPDAALEAMFGTDIIITATTTDSIIGATCQVGGPNDYALFASVFGYVYDAHPGPWTQATRKDSPELTFDGVEGAGTTSTSTVQDSWTTSADFVCGDYYLDLDIYLDLSETPTFNGDPEANLVNLTHSALPWLCQGQVVPGLGGQTLEDARPGRTTPQPLAAHPPHRGEPGSYPRQEPNPPARPPHR